MVELPDADELVVELLEDEPHAAARTAMQQTSAAATGRMVRVVRDVEVMVLLVVVVSGSPAVCGRTACCDERLRLPGNRLSLP